jgi:mannosylglycerate hydrolase
MGRKLTAFIIVAGHLDIEWYQPMRLFRFWTIETFEDLKKAAGREDFGSYILDGQVFPLEEYLEVVPEDEAELCELMKKRKLVIGPFYTQFDEWLPSAENMIRNCLYGKRKAEAYGSYMRAGYLPDNFGHPLQMPQILRGFGIDSLLFMRGLPEIPGGHPDEFIYRGIDGSEVLVSHFRESYAGAFDIFDKKIDPIQPRTVPYYDGDDCYLSFEWHRELADHDDPERTARSLISNVQRIKERYPSGVIPLIAGFDHLPPQINIGDSVKAANDSQDEIEFVMGSAEEYIRLVYERQSKPAVYDMELLGSRYQYVLLGALSTRSYLKRQNFAAEALMERYVEPLDVLASLSGYPGKNRLLDEAWKYLAINSAHDSIHGSSVDEVHTEMEARFAAVRQIAAGLIHDAMGWMGRHTDRG